MFPAAIVIGIGPVFIVSIRCLWLPELQPVCCLIDSAGMKKTQALIDFLWISDPSRGVRVAAQNHFIAHFPNDSEKRFAGIMSAG